MNAKSKGSKYQSLFDGQTPSNGNGSSDILVPLKTSIVDECNNSVFTDSHENLWSPSTNKKAVHFSNSKYKNSIPQMNNSNSAALDWIFLALLGTTMAILSFVIDLCLSRILHCREIIMVVLNGKFIAQFLAWISYATILVTTSAGLCYYIGPKAAGSGFAEIKTSLRGVLLKEYLTPRTFIAKILALPLFIASGAPIGKEAPFVHLSSIMAHQLSKLTKKAENFYTNESRKSEMLAAGCAVGIACTFSSPIGGVLYAMEATGVYFEAQSFKRCFLASTFSSTLYRALALFSDSSKSYVGIPIVLATYQTNFPKNCFSNKQLPLFALLGVICGLTSAIYLFLQRQLVFSLKRKAVMRVFRFWFMYPFTVMFVFGIFTYPGYLGQYFAGERLWIESLRDFFDVCTWRLAGANSTQDCTLAELKVWSNYGHDSPMNVLLWFFVYSFISVCICSTLPVPMGAFIPTLVVGGALGRLYGELISYLMPQEAHVIFPGLYAIVGSAAFCSGVIQFISVAVIMYECTGQSHYGLPILIGVLISYMISRILQPSLYDPIVKVKKLPYISDESHTSKKYDRITADQIMTKDVECISHDTVMQDIADLLKRYPKVQSFPICNSHKSQILIGSCHRKTLEALIRSVLPNSKTWKDKLCLESIEFDTAPFQLTSSAALLHVHSIFTLVKLQRVYITKCGRLEGLITRRELRNGIQAVINGTLKASPFTPKTFSI